MQKVLGVALLVVVLLSAPPARAGLVSLSTSDIAGHPGDLIGWGVEIASPTYWLIVDSVQSDYQPYPDGLSADATPVVDYLSQYFLMQGLVVAPGVAFQQDFQAGIPGDTGRGLGAFYIRFDATPGAKEVADIYVAYALFDGNPYTCGDDCQQVDAGGLPSFSDITETLASSVTVEEAESVPEPAGLLPAAIAAAVILGARKRHRSSTSS